MRQKSILAFAAIIASATMAPAFSMPLYIFATSQDGSSVAQIDTGSSEVRKQIKTSSGPAGIGVDEPGHQLAVTHPDAGTIDLIDVGTGRVRHIDYKGQPFGVALDDRAIYVTDWSKDRVARIDVASGQQTASVAVGKSPAGIVLDRRHHLLYVANRESSDVSVIDCATMRESSRVPAGAAPFALAISPDGKRVYVANVRSNDLTVIDTASLRRVATIKAGATPYGVAVTADNHWVLVTNQHGNTLSIVDASRRVIVASVPVGRYPEGVVAVDGRAFVANWFSGDISVVEIAQRREIGRIKVADGPRNLVVARDNLPDH